MDDKTIIVFVSDNGGVSSGDDYATSNLPLRGGKGYQWEAGTRIPFLIKAVQELSEEVENLFRIQSVGWRDLYEYIAVHGEPEIWLSNGFISKVYVKNLL